MFTINLFFAAFSLVYVAQGFNYTCNFRVQSWQTLVDLYTCYATIANDADQTNIVQLTGNHSTGKGNNDVQFVDVWNQNAVRIPANLKKFFPNLIAIRYVNSQISSIIDTDLKPFPNLINFENSLSSWDTIDANLFKFTPLLQYIKITNNDIAHVGKNLLIDLTALVTADFSGNPCINVVATTPAQILDLNAQLPISCPLPKTTTPAAATTTTPGSTSTSSPSTTSANLISTDSTTLSSTPSSTSSPSSISTPSLTTLTGTPTTLSDTTTAAPKCRQACVTLINASNSQMTSLTNEIAKQSDLLAQLNEKYTTLASQIYQLTGTVSSQCEIISKFSQMLTAMQQILSDESASGCPA